jgi:hypothetical protein
MPWVKGQSGNPGHKSVRDVAWLRRLATEEGEKAIAALVRVMTTSSDDKATVAAAKELLDRAGCVAPKPAELPADAEQDKGPPFKATVTELRIAATNGEA